jgi:hypothetical protein
MANKVRFLIVAFLLIVAVSTFSFVPLTQTPHALASSNNSQHVAHPATYCSGECRYFNYNSDLCIGIAPGQFYAGQWACNHNNDQLWHKNCQNNSAWCNYVNRNGQCLGVWQGSKNPGAPIVGWPCNGNPDQFWGEYFAILDCNSNSNFLNLENAKSHLVLGVLNGSTQNGALLIQWQWNGNLDQCWAPF